MAPTRAAVAALVLGASSLGAPASAQVGPRPVALYPLVAGADANDVQSLLDAALHRVSQRSDDVALAEPLFARAACGPAPAAAPQCLAGLAGSGLVVRTTVHRADALLVVALEAVDARARTFGPVTVNVDAFAQSAEPLAQAVLLLVEQALAAARQKVDLHVPLPPPPKLVAPPSAPTPAPRAWMRTAGPWLTGAGAALLAGAVALSVVNRGLSDELERKFEAGTLTPADLPSYRRVERYNTATRALFASGGAFTIVGVAIWTAAPARGQVVAGVKGTF